ncbi:MAG: protein kinase [Chitinispirillales bacterium]|jgi:tRNA A-37 threonylcarbamoyl transferase component Bud32|nr:protein kinase [Chitinispirillales bacterium]
MQHQTETYGRYKVLELLGEGAMGRVYLSEDPILGRQVAVKVISTDRNLDPIVLNEYLERFKVEAQACARLNHPSIVSIYDAGEEGGVPWIAFEYVSGERLDKLIARQRQLPFDRIAQIAGDIAAAMLHAHGMNIVHRDIKPANILIDDRSQVAKLCDFGVVKSPFTTITKDGTAVGSPGYMSPEQIDNLEVDARSDIFSFGIALYEMLTGTHPFLRDTVQATFFATINCSFTPVEKLREDTPEKLVRIVEKSLVADRNLRIINAEELCLMIAGCMDDEPRRTKLLRATADARRGIGARVKMVYAVALRGVRACWKKIQPFCGRVSAPAVKIYREKGFPFASDVFNRVYGAIKKRFTKSQITIGITAAISLIAVIVMIMLFVTVGEKSGDKNMLIRAAREKGYTVKSGKQLVDIGRGYVDKCDRHGADGVAGILAGSKNKTYVLYGRLFEAMTALCGGRYNDAAALFTEVGKLDGWENAVRREHPFFIHYLGNRMERELPESLTDLYARHLRMHDNQQMKAWTGDRHYWVRWNAVRILQRSGATVDLVPVLILDLDHAGSARTRIRAAERLGDTGDRRAIPALTAARDNRNHPASSTARRVLSEKFNVR